MSNRRAQHIFLRRVGEALSVYQLLEASLKIYIQRAHLRIEKLVLGKVPFHYPPSDYESASLGQLIKMFKRHSENKPLIERLQKANKARNYIAHRVTEKYMLHHEKQPRVAGEISRDLKKREDDGYELFELLQKELRKLDEGSS